MTSANNLSAANLSQVGVEELKKKWYWFLILGFVLITVGTIALGSAVMMTVFSMTLLGWLMIAGGTLEAIHAFGCKRWSGFFVDMLAGLLYVVVGFMVVDHPGAAAATLTLLIALFLLFGGVFRIVVALVMRYQNWGWLLLHGFVNFALGISIWHRWPLSGLWVIGLFVGIDLVFNGWSLVMLGLTAKHLPIGEASTTEATPEPAAGA